jgi:hypothetical protein
MAIWFRELKSMLGGRKAGPVAAVHTLVMWGKYEYFKDNRAGHQAVGLRAASGGGRTERRKLYTEILAQEKFPEM